MKPSSSKKQPAAKPPEAEKGNARAASPAQAGYEKRLLSVIEKELRRAADVTAEEFARCYDQANTLSTCSEATRYEYAPKNDLRGGSFKLNNPDKHRDTSKLAILMQFRDLLGAYRYVEEVRLNYQQRDNTTQAKEEFRRTESRMLGRLNQHIDRTLVVLMQFREFDQFKGEKRDPFGIPKGAINNAEQIRALRSMYKETGLFEEKAPYTPLGQDESLLSRRALLMGGGGLAGAAAIGVATKLLLDQREENNPAGNRPRGR